MPIMLFLILILIFVVLLVVVTNIVIVPQSMVYVVERLGSYSETWSAGLHVKIPFLERVAKKVSLKEQVADFPPQPVITRDNVTMQIDTVVFFQVPSSSIWTRPVVLPKPLMTWLAAITLSWKISPGWGSRAVTPVWTSPSDSVQWPTVTPGTSLILSSGPQGSLPTRMPRFFHSDSIPIQILLTKMPSWFRTERAFFVYSSPCSTRLMAPKS